MKNLILILTCLLTFTMDYAQENQKITPLIHVQGEGKVYTTPDQVSVQVSVETKGKSASEIKKQNDIKIEAVLNAIKKFAIPKEDYQTDRISLNTQYDYDNKKHSYYANQSIKILLKDISKYDGLMEAMVDAGINQINNVEFKSSKLVFFQSEARKKAMKDAKMKAEDYVSVLGQKIGKAITINDNSQTYYPQVSNNYAMAKSADAMESAPRETLAVGEIAIVANVSVSFALD